MSRRLLPRGERFKLQRIETLLQLRSSRHIGGPLTRAMRESSREFAKVREISREFAIEFARVREGCMDGFTIDIRQIRGLTQIHKWTVDSAIHSGFTRVILNGYS